MRTCLTSTNSTASPVNNRPISFSCNNIGHRKSQNKWNTNTSQYCTLTWLILLTHAQELHQHRHVTCCYYYSTCVRDITRFQSIFISLYYKKMKVLLFFYYNSSVVPGFPKCYWQKMRRFFKDYPGQSKRFSTTMFKYKDKHQWLTIHTECNLMHKYFQSCHHFI